MRTKSMHTFMQKKNITSSYNKITIGMLYKANVKLYRAQYSQNLFQTELFKFIGIIRHLIFKH